MPGRPQDAPAEPHPCQPAVTLELVVREHGLFLANYLRSLRVARQDVDDVLQNVFVAVYTSLHRFDPKQGSLRDWLAGIARRQLGLCRRRPHLRREKPDNDVSIIEDDAPNSEERLGLEDEHRILEEILAKVPPERRSILIAYRIDGVVMEEIARSTSVPLGTARTRYRLALEDASTEARRWQNRQRSRRLPDLPWILAPFLWIKRAWAAAARRGWARVLVGLAVLMLAGCAAVLLGPGLAPDQVEVPAKLLALPAYLPLAMTTPRATATVVAPVAASTTLPSPRAARPPAPTPISRPPPPEDWILLNRAQAAFRAGNRGKARRLFEQHASVFPGSPGAGERDTYRRMLGETVRAGALPTTTR